MTPPPADDPPAAGSLLDELMTSEEVAELLAMRRSTIDDYARRGLLPSLKLGRIAAFVRTDVVRAIDELRRRG